MPSCFIRSRVFAAASTCSSCFCFSVGWCCSCNCHRWQLRQPRLKPAQPYPVRNLTDVVVVVAAVGPLYSHRGPVYEEPGLRTSAEEPRLSHAQCTQAVNAAIAVASADEKIRLRHKREVDMDGAITTMSLVAPASSALPAAERTKLQNGKRNGEGKRERCACAESISYHCCYLASPAPESIRCLWRHSEHPQMQRLSEQPVPTNATTTTI